MASTTLVTFLLGHQHGVGSVELIGSWDNFSIKYPMSKDKQKGHGHWSGTHFIKNIVCDGDPAESVTPRDGGLKMGGLYWYYYIRNGHTEFHNPAEATTNHCPLLPGQTVNVLEIPIEPRLYSIRTSSELSLPLTMNPGDRYVTPKPKIKAKEPLVSLASSRSRSSSKRKRSSHLSRSGSAASQRHAKLHVIESRARHDWFAQSVGRLHTAVVDACLSLYAGHNPNTSVEEAHARRRARTAVVGSCKALSALGAGPDVAPSLGQVKRSSSRPKSRFGLRLRADSQTKEIDFDAKFENPFSGQCLTRPTSDFFPQVRNEALHGSSRPRTWSPRLSYAADAPWLYADIHEILEEQHKPASAPGVVSEINNKSEPAKTSISSDPFTRIDSAVISDSKLDTSAMSQTNYRHPLGLFNLPQTCQLPPVSATGSIDWQDVPRHNRNSTVDSNTSFWTPAASSPSTNYEGWSPLLDGKASTSRFTPGLSQGWYTPPSEVDALERKSLDHNEVLAKLKSKFNRRSLAAGNFFDSQETIKPTAGNAGSSAHPRQVRIDSLTSALSGLSNAMTPGDREILLPTPQDMSDLSYLSAAIT